MKSDIEIFFNKRTVLPYLGGALLFTLAGVFILWVALKVQNQLITKLFLFVLGLSSMLFFGLIVLVLLPKLFTHKAGLIIADEGIWDHSSGISAGFVPWGDIKKINYTYSGANTFLVIMLKKPEKFIDKQTNLLKKLTMRLNCKISGSPVHILVSLLKTDLHKLNDLIASKRYAPGSSRMQSR